MWVEIQKELSRRGLYTGKIDGIPGAGTAAGVASVLGITAQKETSVTDTEMLSDHFSRAEMACRCCGACDMQKAELDMCERLREHFGGRAYTVSSGYRCAKHNAEVGGTANSRHLTGRAVDGCIKGVSAAQAVSAAQSMGAHYAYAIDSNYFHVDI